VSVTVGGHVFTAAPLDLSSIPETGLQVEIPGSPAKVLVPPSIFDGLNVTSAAVVVGALDPSMLPEMNTASGEEPVAVKGVVLAEIVALGGEKLSVSGLAEPILITLPVTDEGGMECAYWDEENYQWSSYGVVTRLEGGSVVCEVTHLSFFGGIVRGFSGAIECSQLSLLNKEAIAMIPKGGWFYSKGAMIFWSCLFVLLLTFAGGAYVDRTSRWNGSVCDEYFLISMEEEPEDDNQEGGEEEEELAQRGFLMRACCGVAACFCGIWQCMKESRSLGEALDDICSAFCDQFSNIRNCCESICEVCECCTEDATEHGGRIVVLLNRIMSSLVLSSARRQASARLRVSADDVAFMMEDEDLPEVIQMRQERIAQGLRTAHERRVANEEANAEPSEKATTSRDQNMEDAWGNIHDQVVDTFDAHFSAAASFRRLPCAIANLFLVQNPFGACLVRSFLMSCKMRALFFTVDIFGALMIGTVLYSATGPVTGKEADPACKAPTEFAEQLGRFLAIGVVSMLFAGFPPYVLATLHSRSFMRLPYRNCPEWKRKLRVWFVKDCIVWVFSICYLLFCTFFICLFLANTTEIGHEGWGFSMGISLFQDLVFFPAVVAITIPVLAIFATCIVSCVSKTTRSEMVKKKQMEFAQKVLNRKMLPSAVSI